MSEKKAVHTDLLQYPTAAKQMCVYLSSRVLNFLNELEIEINKQGKHDIQLLPGRRILFAVVY